MKTRGFLFLLAALAVPAGAAPPFDPLKEAAIDIVPGARVPMGVAFADETGRSVTLAGLGAAKPILLVPALHDCPNICGVTLAGLAEAITAQHLRPGADFILVAFGIDPKEKPEAAARSLRRLVEEYPGLAESGGIRALTGDAASIRAVTDALGYRYAFNPKIGQYAHLAATAVLAPDGRLARWLYGLAPEPTDLRLALTEAGEGRTGNLGDRLLLLCYHYDPVTGRYDALAWTAVRLGGAGTALALAGLIGAALLRERRGRPNRKRGA